MIRKKESCNLYQSKEDGCCRVCPKEFDTKDIQLFNKSDTSALHIEKVYYEKTKDLVIIQATENATDKLIVNEKSCSDLYVSSGFNSIELGVTNLVFDVPRKIGTLIHYNLHSDSTPNLVEKADNFKGISGSVVFTYHQNNMLPIAKALIIHNEIHNDFGAENLEELDFDSINDFFKCHVFQREIDTEQDEFKELSKRNKDWLLECFSSNREAKHFLGQPLAPNRKLTVKRTVHN